MNNPAFANPQRGFPLLPRYGCLLARRGWGLQRGHALFTPGYQEAVDRMVERLKQFDASEGAPKPGEACRLS